MKNHVRICISITPATLEKLDDFCASHGDLSRGKAIGLLLRQLTGEPIPQGLTRPLRTPPVQPGLGAGERVVELSAEDWG